ncbi:DUF4189 domain-containing protein [Nocardia flavorosea]|nr:DUF4189 domain-containing protein [Nocardia flavorosea]
MTQLPKCTPVKSKLLDETSGGRHDCSGPTSGHVRKERISMSMMGKAAFTLAVSCLSVAVVSGAGSANAQGGLYAAIAMSESTFIYAVSTDEPGFEEAKAAAIANCGVEDCRVLVSWANGCGALAESKDGVGAGSGPNRAEAERAAYQRLAELTPTAVLANFGSADLSGAKIVEVACTSNAR